MRLATIGLSKAARQALANPSYDSFNALEEFRVAIRLRLNPSDDSKDKFDQKILAGLRVLSQAVRLQREVQTLTELEAIERNMQELLKQEWEKSKQEAQTGELMPGKSP